MDGLDPSIEFDSGIRSIIRLNAILNDWYGNVRQERRGVRTCERIRNIQKQGLVPTAEIYLASVSSQSYVLDTTTVSDLFDTFEDAYRPHYADESELHNWNGYGRGLTRALLDTESRLGGFAVDTGVVVNDHTINIRDTDVLSEDLQEKFASTWREWFFRLNDLYWERRYRISKDIVRDMENGRLEGADIEWEQKLKRYPEFPSGTRIGGERIY